MRLVTELRAVGEERHLKTVSGPELRPVFAASGRPGVTASPA